MSQERVRAVEPTNLMTRATELRLRREFAEAVQLTSQFEQEIGEAVGVSGEWHDNFAYEEAKRAASLRRTRVETLRQSLEGVQIIEPRKETDHVGLGNTVGVQFQGGSAVEEYTILGPHDSATNRMWISYQSPLGSNLMNKWIGETVTYGRGNQKQTLIIRRIEPGKFTNEIEEGDNKPKEDGKESITSLSKDTIQPERPETSFEGKQSNGIPVVEADKLITITPAQKEQTEVKPLSKGEAMYAKLLDGLTGKGVEFLEGGSRSHLPGNQNIIEQTAEFTRQGHRFRVLYQKTFTSRSLDEVPAKATEVVKVEQLIKGQWISLK